MLALLKLVIFVHSCQEFDRKNASIHFKSIFPGEFKNTFIVDIKVFSVGSNSNRHSVHDGFFFVSSRTNIFISKIVMFEGFQSVAGLFSHGQFAQIGPPKVRLD